MVELDAAGRRDEVDGAAGESSMATGASSTSNTRSKLTIAVIRSTRVLVRLVSGS